MRIRPPSVRMRLALWHTAVLTLIISAFSVGIYLFTQASFLSQLHRQLDTELATVRKTLSEEPEELYELEEHESVQLFRVATGDSLLYQTAGWRRAQLGEAHRPRQGGVPQSFTSSSGEQYRVQTEVVHVEDREYRIAVAKPAEPVWRSLQSLRLVLLAAFPGAIALGFVGGYFLAGRLLSPVGALAAKAREITAERLSERLPVQNPDDEFGRLATVFNDTLGRLENAFERLRRFTADASHELRTPLTAIRSVGEVALGDRQDSAAYREVIGSMLEEADHLARLVDSLLTLTRADTGSMRLNRERFDIASLAEEVLDFLRVLAEEKNQTLTLDVREQVIVEADRETLRQALINITDNAIKYSPPDASIRIVVGTAEKHGAVIEVADDGPGIPAEHREKVFDRFYRIDKGRSRHAGGSGLGLAIARWAVETNGGRLELASEKGGGSTFRITLPSTETKEM